MTRPQPSSAAVRACVARACASARDWPTPDLDEHRIEEAVLDRVSKSAMDSWVVRRSLPRPLIWSMAALAGVGCVVGVMALRSAHPQSVAPDPQDQLAQTTIIDGETLAIGRTLHATNQELLVRHAGHASWKLSAHGRAHVVGLGERIVVALDAGRIDAQVVPKSVPETFAIDAENVHVAVHGTVFSVQREGAMVEVAVKVGSVRVTERRRERTPDGRSLNVDADTGRLLVAPASITVEMHPEVVDAPATSDTAKPTKPVSAARAHATAEPAASPERGTENAQPSAEELEQVWDRVAQLTGECFALQTGSDPNVRVSFGTQIAVRIAPTGDVSIAGFNPPLPTTVSRCAAQRASQLHATPTTEGAVVSRAQMLTR